MAKVFKTVVISAGALVALSSLAQAHPGHGAMGLAAGFVHPFSGFDHLAAMLAVGLLAARLGGRALWQVPSAFIAMMIAGGILGMNGITLPYIEFGIAASVLVLGAAVALDYALPVAAAVVLAGGFAVFHGFAHGAEMPVATSGLAYGLGFVLASSLLIATGLGLGRLVIGRMQRLAGIALAAAGAGLLLGMN